MIIGVNGRARSGKNTIADVMVKKFGFTQISFADPLKNICSDAFEIPLNYFHDDNLKDSPFPVPVVVTEQHLERLVTNLISAGCTFTNDQINELNTKGLGYSFISPRNLLQIVGTDLVRGTLGDTTWIDIFKRTIAKSDGNFIVPDARFINERRIVKELGGYNFLIIRPGLPPIAESAHESELLGISEQLIDVTILNDSTVNSLQMEIELWWGAKKKALGYY
jgi:hypothetical protein